MDDEFVWRRLRFRRVVSDQYDCDRWRCWFDGGVWTAAWIHTSLKVSADHAERETALEHCLGLLMSTAEIQGYEIQGRLRVIASEQNDLSDAFRDIVKVVKK